MKRIFVPLVCLIVLSCSKDGSVTDLPAQVDQGSPGSIDQSDVLVKVNSTEITEAQLELAIQRIAGPIYSQADEVFSKKVLDSLVLSRNMAIAAEKSLDEEEKQHIELMVNSYREELLVKKYLDENADPEPVSAAMVSAYYEENPEEFGGDLIKKFEYVATVGVLDDQKRETARRLLREQASDEALGRLQNRLTESGISAQYKIAELKVSLIQEPLKGLVEELPPGELSQIHDGQQIILAKVLEQRMVSPRSLAEVSGEIRKKLAPLQLKKAVQKVGENLKSQADIEYIGISE